MKLINVLMPVIYTVVIFSSTDAGKVSIRIIPSHPNVLARLEAAGIFNDLSQDCNIFYSENNCTSFDGFSDKAFNGLVALKNASGCLIVLTGAFEKTGVIKYTKDLIFNYGAEINKDGCIDNYIESNFIKNGTTQDGAVRYISPSGSLYVDEKDYWHYRYYYDLPML